MPFQARVGGKWVGGKPEKEILDYDLFPSSLKTFSYSHANTSSFSAATRASANSTILEERSGALLRGSPAPSAAVPP